MAAQIQPVRAKARHGVRIAGCIDMLQNIKQNCVCAPLGSDGPGLAGKKH